MNTFIKRLMSFKAVMRIITEGVMLQIWKRIQVHMLISVDFACSAVIYKVFVQSIQLQKPVAKNRYKVCYTVSLDKKNSTKNATAVCLFENHRRARSNCTFINRK